MPQANKRGERHENRHGISGGDVTGINNFVFQVSNWLKQKSFLFNGGIPGLLQNGLPGYFHQDLVDFFRNFIHSDYVFGSNQPYNGWRI